MSALKSDDLRQLQEQPLGPDGLPEELHRLARMDPNALERERLARRNEERRAEGDVTDSDAAVRFAYRSYPDLMSNQHLTGEMVRRHRAIALKAAEKGEAVDWIKELPAICEGIRKDAGLPTSDPEKQAEAVRELRRARGLE